MNFSVDVPPEVLKKFEVFEWRNALALLRTVHVQEWGDVTEILSAFELKRSQLVAKGKNKTQTAKALDEPLQRRGWVEKSFDTKIVVDGAQYDTPTHAVDCFKNRVALEVEWNNKDPFFDRDLNNFRLLYDLRVIDLGLIVTRTTALQSWLSKNHKQLDRDHGTYGASTTHSEKLYPRIIGGGAGGCPVAVFSIRQEAFVHD